MGLENEVMSRMDQVDEIWMNISVVIGLMLANIGVDNDTAFYDMHWNNHQSTQLV